MLFTGTVKLVMERNVIAVDISIISIDQASSVQLFFMPGPGSEEDSSRSHHHSLITPRTGTVVNNTAWERGRSPGCPNRKANWVLGQLYCSHPLQSLAV